MGRFSDSYDAGRTYFTRYLDLTGDGTGTKNANVNASTAAQDFQCTPSSSQTMIISRLLVSLTDTGTLPVDGYGAGAALTNGVTIVLSKNGTETDLTDGIPLKTNSQWGSLCFDFNQTTKGGAVDNILTVRWTFQKGGTSLQLNGSQGDKFIARVNDNHTNLVTHYYVIQGYYATGQE